MFQQRVIAQFDLLISMFTTWYFNRFKIDLFNFHSFIANISTKWNISAKWNAQTPVKQFQTSQRRFEEKL